MKRAIFKKLLVLVLAVLTVLSCIVGAFAGDTTDPEVQSVIQQLEAIDTLQEIQNKRSEYPVTFNHYDSTTTDSAVINQHETARAGYEAYVAAMFSARVAAQQAYEALTAAQQAQIDPALVAKLNDELPNVIHMGTFPVTPRNNEYQFEAVDGGNGYGYEVSNHMVYANIPQTFILVDTADGKTSWTPNGLYEFGVSNYEVTYCCDVETGLKYSSHYKRVNLEDSSYYSQSAAEHIRAILMQSYPFISLEEMKANLKAGGLSADFVDGLSRSDIIAAVQMAVWAYSNMDVAYDPSYGYFASVDITKNLGRYFDVLHDTNNEYWDWRPGKGQRTFDIRARYRVNTLAYYLCQLEGIPQTDDGVVISDVKITRADLVANSDSSYRVGMYVYLNNSGTVEDDLKITVTSYRENADGSSTVVAQNAQMVSGRSEIQMSVKANPGDKIKVTVEGTQYLGKGVYLYEPEDGHDSSQTLVGVAEGSTTVHTEDEFVFEENVHEMGLRIHKTETGTGKPLSDITFNLYKVVPGEGESLNETPTDEELAIYKTEENWVAALVTDKTGYASVELEEGTYLVVEEPYPEKIVAPVEPFYVSIPGQKLVEKEDGTTEIELYNIVSIYPKNEPVPPPPVPPPPIPPPDDVEGQFEIKKYDAADSSVLLEGAQFEVCRAATSVDEASKTVVIDGVQYAVVPVTVDGAPLILTTDANGYAISPVLPCDTYFLVEVTAPKGYNLLEEAVQVVVTSNAMTTMSLAEIPNERGNILPETGGIGTTIFLVVGGILMLVAVVLLVTRRRMDKYK